MYLVLEYMAQGDLIHYLKEKDGDNNKKSNAFKPMVEQELWHIFKQAVSGIRYLHYQNIIHGDIKPQVNLLLDFFHFLLVFLY